mgnify:CR=1 FL=1
MPATPSLPVIVRMPEGGSQEELQRIWAAIAPYMRQIMTEACRKVKEDR